MELEARHIRVLRLTRGDMRESEIPAAVEYRTKHGSGYLPLWAEPDEAFARESGASALKLLQGEDGAWRAVVYGADGARAEWGADAALVDALLESNGIANPMRAPEFIASPEQARQAQEEAAQARNEAERDAPPW